MTQAIVMPGSGALPVPAALQSKAVGERLGRQGWKLREWKQRGSPVPIRNGRSTPGRWLDHPYRLVNPGTGEVVWVTEPYGIELDDIAELAQLRDEGWDVSLNANYAMHYPGWTIAVWIRRK